MSDPGNTVNTVCTEVFGTAPDSVRRAEVGMVNTVCILTVGIGKYILRLNSGKSLPHNARGCVLEKLF